MVRSVGRNANKNDTAEVVTVALNSTTATVVSAANTDRLFFHVNNNSANFGFWVRLYPAATDNIKQGVYLSAKTGTPVSWEMALDNVYTGEISAIAATDSPVAYVTEY